jgi:hypothetical protein
MISAPFWFLANADPRGSDQFGVDPRNMSHCRMIRRQTGFGFADHGLEKEILACDFGSCA